MSNKLFFFGSLRDADLFEIVIGRPLSAFKCSHAVLADHTVERLKEFPYPRLVRAPGRNATGLLVGGLEHWEIERTSFYETAEYDLITLAVNTSTGTVDTGCYIATDSLETMAETGISWSIDEWREDAKTTAMAEAEIAMGSYFGRIPRDQIDNYWEEIELLAEQLLAERERTRTDVA